VDVGRAIQAFGAGFSFTKSFTRPFVFVPLGPLWLLRDAETRKENRRQEAVVFDVEPAAAHRTITESSEADNPFVCAIRRLSDSEQPIVDGWKALGYRLLGREALMFKPLNEVPRFEGPFPVRRIESWEEAQVLNKAAGSRQILPENIGKDALRLYGAWEGAKPVGWVRSISCGEDAWVSNMYVRSEYRRRGIGRSLMSAMLFDDRRLGFENSVLLASVAGSKLYPCLGYEKIGELALLCPPKA
jgi:GNAT superfamily N-acetyltransferase